MKNNLIIACIALVLAGFGAGRASAQIFANDDASSYTAWGTGTNYGFGFLPWVLYGTGNIGGTSGYGGTFLDTGGPIASTNGNYWGIYANSASTVSSEAFRAFSNSLPVNATFKIRWQNNGIGTGSGNAGGFNLRSGNNTNLQTVTSFLSDGSQLSVYYIGGSSDNFDIYDGNGVNTLPVNFSTGSGGLTVEVTLLSGGMYNLVIENASGTSVLWSTNDQPLVSGGSIDSVAMYAFDTDQNQDFNNLEILNLAPQIINLQPANDTPYVPTSTPLSFAVTSSSSTIASNQIQLTLNGFVQSGANWSVFGSGTSSNQVMLNTPLQDNLVYNGSIVATDASGNSFTNNFSFNTWVPAITNIYIEAGDYNYQGGNYVNNFTTAQPNQVYGQLDLLGENGFDYYVYNTNTAGETNLYRQGDFPALEDAVDVDHNNFANNGFQPYNLAYNATGQWEDYTRVLSNKVTYAVYARMSGFSGGTVSFERMATPQVLDTTNQPGAVLGTFVCPDTGGIQDWTFVPLKDFFSNPVLVNLGGTNTFRITDISGNGTYNISYMVLVAVTNSGALPPYVTAGFPYPSATGVSPGQTVSFTIANGQTSVVPGSIQLFINSSNVTSGLTFSNNAAGTIVTYQPAYPDLLAAGNDTAEVVFSDGSVSVTNSWQFNVETLPVISSSWALPLTSSYSRGISEQIAKGDDNATNTDFLPSVARAEAQLAGTLTNSQTGQPYANEALNGGLNIETNVINYAVDPTFNAAFPPASPFPDITPGTTNNVAMAANMYVQLSPGVYTFDVYSDDGFQFSAGATPTSTNMILGIANFGRGASGTPFSFIVTTNGLYPMQLIYFKSQEGGGGVELYSINQTNAAGVFLNDPNNASSVKVYYVTSAKNHR
jgi:hypothetical protein